MLIRDCFEINVGGVKVRSTKYLRNSQPAYVCNVNNQGSRLGGSCTHCPTGYASGYYRRLMRSDVADRSFALPTTLSDLKGGTRGSKFCVDLRNYAPSVWIRTNKFGRITHITSDMFLVGRPRPIPKEGPQRSQHFRFIESDHIRYGNTCERNASWGWVRHATESAQMRRAVCQR